MSLFGFEPPNVLARARAASVQAQIPTLSHSLLFGAIGFGGVSTLVFTTVAFDERWLYRHLGIGGAYALWASLFLLGGGGVLSRLVIGPARTLRFTLLFGCAFLLYAATWMLAYFVLKNQAGEWLGSLAGSLLMALVFCGAFSAGDAAGRIIGVLCAANVAGYFLGRLAWTATGGKTGMIAWGVIYGIGFGLGLGFTLHACQKKVRDALNARV